MLYIYDISCISSQQIFLNDDRETLRESSGNQLKAIEPSYESIPQNALRRMGKAVKICVGAAIPLIKKTPQVNGIIIGTANGGMEDCIKFMNQIIAYDEGMLTPGNFVQSTPNGLAAQIGLMQHNKGYNITHTHRGLSFENAIMDAQMRLKEFPKHHYLLGAADEISTYNYNVDLLDGWYKKEIISNKALYTVDSPGSIAGEGAVMLLAGSEKEPAIARICAIHILHSKDERQVMNTLNNFLERNGEAGSPEILISGENGDNRFLHFYESVEKRMDDHTAVLRFKHMSGEYPTASAQALWMACQILQKGIFPKHMIKKGPATGSFKNILIYNNYKEAQHSFMLVSKP